MQTTPEPERMHCSNYDMTVTGAVLTQTAVGQDDEGVRLAAAPAFLTPGRNGDGSF